MRHSLHRTIAALIILGISLGPNPGPARAGLAPATRGIAYTGWPGGSFVLVGTVFTASPTGGAPKTVAYAAWGVADERGVVTVDFAAQFPEFVGELAFISVHHPVLPAGSAGVMRREGDALAVTRPFTSPVARDWETVRAGTWAATEYRGLAELGMPLNYVYSRPIARGEFFTLVLRGLGWVDQLFPAAGARYEGEIVRWLGDLDRAIIELAVQRGVIRGRGPGDLALGSGLTRAEAATFLLRTAGVEADTKLPNPFTDVPAAHWARSIVATAASRGVVGGYGGGKFGPEDALTWEQGVALVFRQCVRGTQPGGELYGYYAIAAFQQRGLVPQFSGVAFGWSRLAPGGVLDLKGRDFYWPIVATVTGPDGVARPYSPSNLVADSRAAGVKRHLMVFATNDNKLIDSFLADPAAQARFNASLLGLLRQEDFDGVNLDFEYLGLRQQGAELAATRAAYVTYVAGLKALLAAEGRELYLSVHAPNSWFPGYDYTGLAAHADALMIMAYDYVSTRQPEPLAKVEEAARLAATLAPPEKLILGINAWHETPASVAAKLELARNYNLRGVGVWRIGLLSPEFIAALQRGR